MRTASARSVESLRPKSLEADTVCEAFQITAREHAGRVALRTKGNAVSIRWSEYAEQVRRLAAGLAALDVKQGETLGLMLVNRPEFHVVDTAALHLGATCFSIYNTSAPEQIEYLLGDAANRVIVTERQFLPRILEVRDRIPRLEHVVVVDGPADGAITLEEVVARGKPDFDFEAAWRAVEPDDVACLIYTSGTTGPPKGVQITHRNLVAEMRALLEIVPLPQGARVVSYLPAAHIGDRLLSHYSSIFLGYELTSCPDMKELFAHVPDARPTVFGGVPRVWEKLKAALEAAMASEPDAEKRKATAWALDVGRKMVRARQEGKTPPAELRAEHGKAEALVLSKIRERVGLDAVELSIAGAAATPVEVLEFFAAIGIEILELWGMSETAGVGTINPPDRPRFGTVGKALPGVEICIADDGELLMRGPMVMKGYRNMPQKTAGTISPEGWLHTGDVAEIDADGYVKIVDRKKELIINAAGKNMSPANIESQLKSGSALIGQAIAIGDGRPYNVALLTLDPDVAPVFARQNGIADVSAASLASHPAVLAEVERGVAAANEHLSRVEQIKRFRILPVDWLPGGDELTPTMKLKRKPIHQKYSEEIAALYAND